VFAIFRSRPSLTDADVAPNSGIAMFGTIRKSDERNWMQAEIATVPGRFYASG